MSTPTKTTNFSFFIPIDGSTPLYRCKKTNRIKYASKNKFAIKLCLRKNLLYDRLYVLNNNVLLNKYVIYNTLNFIDNDLPF